MLDSQKKGIDCPGYRKPLVWINRTESDATPPVQRPTKQGADGHGNFVFKAQRIKSSPKNDDDGDDGKGTRGDGVVVVRKLANRPPVPQLWPSADPDVLRLMDWAAYHNDVAAPTLVPDAAFVHMLQAPLGEWIACQQAVQDLWVLLAMQHRVISTAETNPQSDAEVCRYRVRSVAGLNRLLADPETQLTDDALEAVMMLLMAEPHWDAFSHDSFVPLPWPLFWSIIRTNDVRASMARLNFAFSDAPDPAADERTTAHAFRAAVAAVLRHIRAFDADAWFRRRQDPARCVRVQNAADYVTLLHCLRDAALLYALRTLVVELTAPFRAWLDDGDDGSPAAVFDGKNAEDVRRGCVRALLARLGFPGVDGVDDRSTLLQGKKPFLIQGTRLLNMSGIEAAALVSGALPLIIESQVVLDSVTSEAKSVMGIREDVQFLSDASENYQQIQPVFKHLESLLASYGEQRLNDNERQLFETILRKYTVLVNTVEQRLRSIKGSETQLREFTFGGIVTFRRKLTLGLDKNVRIATVRDLSVEINKRTKQLRDGVELLQALVEGSIRQASGTTVEDDASSFQDELNASAVYLRQTNSSPGLTPVQFEEVFPCIPLPDPISHQEDPEEREGEVDATDWSTAEFYAGENQEEAETTVDDSSSIVSTWVPDARSISSSYEERLPHRTNDHTNNKVIYEVFIYDEGGHAHDGKSKKATQVQATENSHSQNEEQRMSEFEEMKRQAAEKKKQAKKKKGKEQEDSDERDD
ncbi:hypothetical protein SLS54_002442 [Diplodia seriata]